MTSPKSDSSTLSFPDFSSLPVMAMREKIVAKILENRVTLIVGETGCGKSSQVPQFLLEKNMEPILCTQPRRFAVVAVAEMVAKSRNCELGGEIGYHIGHLKKYSSSSKIIFKTAGVLLDEMRDKGMNALKYKAIILDEVHERSPESDLVLVCLKQFLLKKNDLRVVLMSATADINRYKDYFGDIGRGERVEVLAIPNSSRKTNFQRTVSYLEKVSKLVGLPETSSEELSLKYCSGPNSSMAHAEINPLVYDLIHDLILYLHNHEPDIEKSILVFLPSYYALEQQWKRMKPLTSTFKVHILHSSIDTEQALMAMKILKSHRKIILATNIAESSVTIPKVAFVIDSCRSLQVFWDGNQKKDSPELVWVSKSQADQRKGRTGRTCDGLIYRLVTSSFYNKLADHERPAILRLSLRQQVLHICCGESKAINDPKVLLQKALDPPDPEVVDEALDLLVRMQAIKKLSHRVRYEPTFYGRLLASLGLSFDASVFVLKFGETGKLREGILLGILMDTQPLPIFRPFGDVDLFTEFIDDYLGGYNKIAQTGQKETILLANLCAFQFWQRVFKDKHRLERLNLILENGELETFEQQLPNIEEEWCLYHHLVQSSLRHLSDIYEDTINSVHQFRPNFLGRSGGLPTYYDPHEFEHTCQLNYLSDGDTYDDEAFYETRKCCAVPFVASNHFQINDVSSKLANIIPEMRLQYAEDAQKNQHQSVDGDFSLANVGIPVCRYFLSGSCSFGIRCMYSHSFTAKKPVCKFFLSLQGCRNGDLCYFSHELGPSAMPFRASRCLQEDDNADGQSFLQLLPASSDGCILVLDDTDLSFSSNIARHCDPCNIISTTSLSSRGTYIPSLTGVTILWGQHNPHQPIISKQGQNGIPWSKIKCVFWFPNLAGYSSVLETQKTVIQNFFEHLAIRLLADSLSDVRVVVTMNNQRFSQLQMEKLARDSFFFLTESFPFDEYNFGVLPDILTTRKPMLASRVITYIFNFHPPSDIQSGDFTNKLGKLLQSE